MDWIRQLGRYIVVMLLQVLLFNQLQLFGVCHPYVYVMCLLMMPLTLSQNADMIIGAAVGLVMDMFCNSLGVHTAACILLMFIRPYLVGVLVNDKDRLNEQLTSRTLGIEAMIKYVVIMVLIHHFMVFMLAAWSWTHFWFVLAETAVSSLLTIAIILGYSILNDK
ncbi:MAG: rod shape-determining protein MreD [Paludibacteraceae bacterium]|nr:rod shape-determining protein MreD [Paludibacteraceae bacterium]